MLAALLTLGGTLFAKNTVIFPKESIFYAGKYKIYATKADFSIQKQRSHVTKLDLKLWLYRGELYHMVKAGVTHILDTKRLLQYKPLVPIIVQLQAKPVVLRALDKAAHGGKAMSKELALEGPWRHLLNYTFILSKQEVRKR